MGKKNAKALIVLCMVLILFPFLVTSDYYLSIMIFMGINAIIVMGLSLLMGYAGQISLGHAAYFGIGAYCSGVLTVHFGIPAVFSFFAGVIFSALMALAIAVPTLKLKGHYLAVATLGFGEIVSIIFNELLELTGGPSGLSGIPNLQLFGYPPSEGRAYFYFVWAVFIVLLVFTLNVIHSRTGRALRAMHGSELAASAMGLNVSKLKVQIFLLSAAYASIAGSLYAHFVTFISPPTFGLSSSILFLMMVVIGGRSIWGALLGAGILTLLPEYLRAFKDFDVLVYGLILTGMLLFMPQGLLEGSISLLRRLRRRASGHPATSTLGLSFARRSAKEEK